MARSRKPTISDKLREAIVAAEDECPEASPTELMRLRQRVASNLYAGADPKTVPLGDLLYMAHRCPSIYQIGASSSSVNQKFSDRIKGPLSSIRAYCVDCQGGVPSLVRECAVTKCPNWPFRMGSNPFYGKLHDADASAEEEEETNAH